jgi:hypothetical protein
MESQQKNNRQENEISNMTQRQQEKMNTINNMLQQKNEAMQDHIDKMMERFEKLVKEFGSVRNNATNINNNLNNTDFIGVGDLISTIKSIEDSEIKNLITKEVCPKITRKNRKVPIKRTRGRSSLSSSSSLGRPKGKRNSYQRVRRTKEQIAKNNAKAQKTRKGKKN